MSNTVTLIPSGVSFPPLNPTAPEPLSNLSKGLIIGGIVVGLVIIFGVGSLLYSYFQDYKTEIKQDTSNASPQEDKMSFAAYTIHRVTSKTKPGLQAPDTFVSEEELQVRKEYQGGNSPVPILPSPREYQSPLPTSHSGHSPLPSSQPGKYQNLYQDERIPTPVQYQNDDTFEPQILILKHKMSNGDLDLVSKPVFVPESGQNESYGQRPVSGGYIPRPSSGEVFENDGRVSRDYDPTNQRPVSMQHVQPNKRPVSGEYVQPNQRLVSMEYVQPNQRPVSMEYARPNQRPVSMEYVQPSQRPVSMQYVQQNQSMQHVQPNQMPASMEYVQPNHRPPSMEYVQPNQRPVSMQYVQQNQRPVSMQHIQPNQRPVQYVPDNLASTQHVQDNNRSISMQYAQDNNRSLSMQSVQAGQRPGTMEPVQNLQAPLPPPKDRPDSSSYLSPRD